MKGPVQIFLCIVLITGAQCKFKTVCYFTATAKDRNNTKTMMEIDDIDPMSCTHLVWVGAGIDTAAKKIKSMHGDEEGSSGRFMMFNDLKKKNKMLKTLLCIGGMGMDDAFMAISDTADNMNAFATNAAMYLREKRFDGLDVAWMYPVKDSSDMKFVNLLKSLQMAFKKDGSGLMLSACVSGVMSTINEAYDIKMVHPYVDYLSVMAFGYHTKDSDVAAMYAPLYMGKSFSENANVNWTVNYLMKMSQVPAMKIVIGLSWMGLRLTLADQAMYEPGNTTTDEKKRGPWMGMENMYSYPEICDMMEKGGAMDMFDMMQMAPYLVYMENFVGYENKKSIMKKMKFFAMKKIGGVAIHSLDLDDITGTACNDGKSPLLKAVKDQVKDLMGMDDDMMTDNKNKGKEGDKKNGTDTKHADATNLLASLSVCSLCLLLHVLLQF